MTKLDKHFWAGLIALPLALLSAKAASRGAARGDITWIRLQPAGEGASQ